MLDMSMIFAIIFGVVFVAIFIFSILMIVSPKFRGKMMARQMKSAKYMLDAAGNDMTEMAAKGAKIARTATEKSKDDLAATAQMKADIEKEAIKTKARAVREGLFDDSSEMYCKHCGKEIPTDSKFCKYCGKEQ